MSQLLRTRPTTPDPAALIRDKALALGFDAVGFGRADLGPEARARLAAFLAAGQHGDMGWLATRAEQRSHPRALWPEAVSVIALGLSYAPEDDPLEIAATSRFTRAGATTTMSSRGCSSTSPNSSSRASARR
jgi:epoxyqueuosine reductase QueG